MSEHLAKGVEVLWTSNTRRVRRVRIITALKDLRGCFIVKITEGLPGEKGQHRVVPPRRLATEGGAS